MDGTIIDMADVQFSEENTLAAMPRPVAKPKGPSLTGMLMKWGVVKTEAQANGVLLGIAIAAVLLAGIIVFLTFGGADTAVIEDIPRD